MFKLLASLCCVSLCRYAVSQEILGLFEGDVCKQDQEGAVWTCKSHKDCPRIDEEIKGRSRPSVCRFVGRDPVVCCQPGINQKPRTKLGATAKQMCLKYAESVYIQLPDLGEGKSLFDTCSKVKSATLSVKDATPREFPHVALVGYGERSSIEWLCGGSLISDRYVVSSARCSDTTRGLAKWVRLGEYNRKSNTDEEQGRSKATDYEIIERINHPDFKKGSGYDDIALYKLDTTVKFNEFIRPTCLETDHQFVNTHVIVAGWGQTDRGSKGNAILHKSNLTTIARKECNDSYKEIIGKKLAQGIKDDSMFCAGELGSEKNTCEVDVGGPLQLHLKDVHCMYSLVGIYSWGAKCGGDKPGVYTRVSHYVPWIESVVWTDNAALNQSYYITIN